MAKPTSAFPLIITQFTEKHIQIAMFLIKNKKKDFLKHKRLSPNPTIIRSTEHITGLTSQSIDVYFQQPYILV
jgi:hypothetical protein